MRLPEARSETAQAQAAPAWLVEEGIGEERAIRLAGAHIADAAIEWPEALRPGLVEDARLIARPPGSGRGTARFASGALALVDRLPAGIGEGAMVRLEITRAALAEERRIKWARARPTARLPARAPSLAERLRAAGHEVQIVRRFPPCDWDELLGEAFDRQIAFAGGVLHCSPTPAMTLIDIDAEDPPERAALAAIAPLAGGLRRFALGGAIAIDFPSLAQKAARAAIDRQLGVALQGWPHERTAMNGFGLVQIVARLERPSLLHLASHHGPALAARLLLRRAEHLSGPGRLLLTAHPAVWAQLRPEWLEELARRTGRASIRQECAGLAIHAPQAQLTLA